MKVYRCPDCGRKLEVHRNKPAISVICRFCKLGWYGFQSDVERRLAESAKIASKKGPESAKDDKSLVHSKKAPSRPAARRKYKLSQSK